MQNEFSEESKALLNEPVNQSELNEILRRLSFDEMEHYNIITVEAI